MNRARPKRPTHGGAWLLIPAAGAILLTGCLVIPVDFHAGGSRHNVNAEVQSKLQSGVMTKEEVFLWLGEPDHVSEDGQRIGYAWRKVKVLWIVVLPPYGGGPGGEIDKSYLLQVSFDPSNRVSGVNLLTQWGPTVSPERTPRAD